MKAIITMDKRAGIVLIVASISVAVIFSIVAMYRSLTGLENVLLQVFSLGIGLIGSYVLGRESAGEAAKAILKPHARSAFRRLLSLYQSLSRLAVSIQNARPDADPVNSSILNKLEAIVIEQIATADDAIEDWRDIVPEDVEELHAKLAARRMENKE
jgi:hypothetical protein